MPEGSDDDRRPPLLVVASTWSMPSSAMQPRGPRRPRTTLTYRVHLKSNSAWWELHAEHVGRFEATVTHAAQIQQYLENFEGKDFQHTLEEALFLQQVAKSHASVLGRVQEKSLPRLPVEV